MRFASGPRNAASKKHPAERNKMNLYELLGIPKDAEPPVIRAAHRAAARRYHPDNAESGDAEKFREVQEALEILIDPKRRKRYDVQNRTDKSKVTPERIKMFISHTMATVVDAERGDGSSDDPVYENIRDKIIASIKADRKSVHEMRYRASRKMERAQRLLDRFKPNADVADLVREALEDKKQQLQEQIYEYEDAIELSTEVEKVFVTYGYEVGPQSEGQDDQRPTISRRRLFSS
jgi:curved DNA-binding protein CbpA